MTPPQLGNSRRRGESTFSWRFCPCFPPPNKGNKMGLSTGSHQKTGLDFPPGPSAAVSCQSGGDCDGQ
ncbi:unnamed protein product [Urochloa humidicola]